MYSKNRGFGGRAEGHRVSVTMIRGSCRAPFRPEPGQQPGPRPPARSADRTAMAVHRMGCPGGHRPCGPCAAARGEPSGALHACVPPPVACEWGVDRGAAPHPPYRRASCHIMPEHEALLKAAAAPRRPAAPALRITREGLATARSGRSSLMRSAGSQRAWRRGLLSSDRVARAFYDSLQHTQNCRDVGFASPDRCSDHHERCLRSKSPNV